MAQSSPQIYVRQLLCKQEGYPLYYPEPPENLPLEYCKQGVSIGDVGIIKADGKFQFAFNIFTPWTGTDDENQINIHGVPDNFTPLPFNRRHVERLRNKREKGSELMSKGVEKTEASVNASAGDGANATIGFNLTSSSSETAVLTMPDGAMGEDYLDLATIRRYSVANAMLWYTFINETLGREAPNGSLYVVTGWDKSTAWGIATMGEASSSSSFSLQFTAVKASIGANYSCSWSSTGGAVTRSSAPSELGLDTSDQPPNQCLFIRGYKVMVREGITAMFGGPGQVESIVDHSKAGSLLRWQNSRSFPGASNGRSNVFKSRGGKGRKEAADGWSAEKELDPLVGAYHALDTINKYMLETRNDAEVAITHESDWWALSSVDNLADEKTILNQLSEQYVPCVESQGVFLVPPEIVHVDDTKGKAASVMHLRGGKEIDPSSQKNLDRQTWKENHPDSHEFNGQHDSPPFDLLHNPVIPRSTPPILTMMHPHTRTSFIDSEANQNSKLPASRPWLGTVDINTLTKDDVIIAVMGATGAGKSSLVSMLIGGDSEMTEHDLESETRDVRAVRCQHPSDPSQSYILLDTPGFDDTHLIDTDILIEISGWLTATYKRSLLLSGILFLHRISDNRVAGSALRNLDMFRLLCGDDGLSNVVFVTTMWGLGDEAKSEKREEELKERFWKPMIDHQARTARFHHTAESAWELLGLFTQHHPVKLQIQTQMVDEGKPLAETSAGLFLESWLKVLSSQFKSISDWFKRKLANTPSDAAYFKAELEKEYLSAEKNERQVKMQQDRLNVQSLRSSRSLRPRSSWDESTTSISSSAPLVTAASSPLSPSSPSSSRRRTFKAIQKIRKLSANRSVTVPASGSPSEETALWEKYGTIKFPAGYQMHTGNNSLSPLIMMSSPDYYRSQDRGRRDSHMSGERHDSFLPHTSPEIPSQPPLGKAEVGVLTTATPVPQAVRLLLSVHSLAFEVADLIDSIDPPSEMTSLVAEDSRRFTATSQSQGYSGRIDVVESLLRDLVAIKDMLLAAEAEKADQETFDKTFLACKKSLKKFSKGLPGLSTSSSLRKRWFHYDTDVQPGKS